MAATRLATLEKRLRAHALALPEAYEAFPWGERVIKVAQKIFVFLNCDASGGLKVTVKLGPSSEEVLRLPFTQPTGYGLGKSGWVTASFTTGDAPPEGILCDWIADSYRLVAPKRLAARLP